ncbi:flagellar biosynthesis anti-sigma factor FlgM [Magnetococcales bacterium HHB-1]
MKIKGYNLGKLDRLARSQYAKGRSKSRRRQSGSSLGDDVSVSSEARLIHSASEAAQQAPEMRMERVEPLRDALQSGRYSVDSLDVADKILREVLMERKQAV